MTRSKNNFETLQNLVLEWGQARGIGSASMAGAMAQMTKVREETGEVDLAVSELFALYSVARHDAVKLEIGDLLVTIIMLCSNLDLDPVQCLNAAYEKIKNRRGKTINGIFVKQEDLHE